MTTVDVVDLITKLQAREQALGDPLDVPRSTRAFADYWAMRRELAATRSALMNLPNDLAREQREFENLVACRAAVLAKQAEIEQQIAEANQVDARIEDLDARLRKANERIERHRAQLTAHLEQAEAMLAEPVTQ